MFWLAFGYNFKGPVIELNGTYNAAHFQQLPSTHLLPIYENLSSQQGPGSFFSARQIHTAKSTVK